MYAPNTYTKKVLVPLWSLHIFFDMVLTFAMVYLMLNTSGETGKAIPASYDASFAFFVACIGTEPLEAILYGFRVLQPWTYLVFQVGKTLFWSIYLPISIARPANGTRDTIWLVLTIFVVLVTYVTRQRDAKTVG
ncbi:hypothetical protein Tdes44962_MAKER04870 [Teratosphaeria destructans]|uniref:Uncharacterized protein n=1 Tax=Teratosphaeria destructans TaxID=418781 RepID=A0A9W7SL29_9PEZI|nr:hypothetical protein Tdes44962_MAKER04870 [Teratosphaeria destructans]